MKRLLGRLAGFTGLPVLSALIPLVILPIVARAAGAEDWLALTVGQAIGTYASTVAYVGWNVLGTPLVAGSSDQAERKRLYGASFFVRAVVVVVLSIPSMVIASLISPAGAGGVAALFAAAALVPALSLSWFAVGVGAPRMILIYELVPRIVGTGLCAGIVLATGTIEWYGVVLLVAPLVGLGVFHLRWYHSVVPPWTGWASIRHYMVSFRAAWGLEATGNLYSNAPLPVASVLAPVDAAAGYASSDKIYRYSLFVIAAAGNAFQGWVLDPSTPDRRRVRFQSSFIAMLALGVTGGSALAIFGAPATRVLFGDAVAGSSDVFILLGIAFAAVATSTPLIRNSLVPARHESAVFVTTVVSAIAGLFVMVVGTANAGVVGVAAGLAMSELSTLIVCAVMAYRVEKAAR